MIINSITLGNFGIYQGDNQFDLRTDKDKNIIIINGKNGSGKTTLLNAFKIGLYGSRIMGYKTNHHEYFDYIRSRMNAYSINTGIRSSYVHITIDVVEKGVKRNYTIERNWTLHEDNSVSEDLSVVLNGIKVNTLNSAESSDFIEQLTQTISPDYIDLFFFDGEKIDHLLTKSESQEYIMDMFNKLFNLDLFNVLDKDLHKYLHQKNTYDQLSDQVKAFDEQINKLKELDAQRLKLEHKSRELDNSKAKNTESIRQIEKEFKSLGGLKDTEQNILEHEINSLISKREASKLKLKDLTIEYLPFLLCASQLSEIDQQLVIEQAQIDNKVFFEKLGNAEFEKYLSIDGINLTHVINAAKKTYEIDKNFKVVHDLSYSEQAEINSLIKEIKENSTNDVFKCLKDISRFDTRIKKLKDQLNANKTDDIKTYAMKITNLQNSIEQIDTSMIQINQELNELIELKSQIQLETDNLQKELKTIMKDQGTYTMISTIRAVIDQYVKETRQVKLEQLEDFITDIFSKLIRKDDFIKEIKIDIDSEQFMLFNSFGGQVYEANLSAGERQIFILSVVWGLLKISKRRIPIVFDTLLGRLDNTHKKNIVEHFLHELGDQIIVLATDSEIDDGYLDLMKDYISKRYVIDFESETKQVSIKEGMTS